MHGGGLGDAVVPLGEIQHEKAASGDAGVGAEAKLSGERFRQWVEVLFWVASLWGGGF